MPPIFIVPMPTIRPQQSPGPGSGPGAGAAQRSTFRPPWIKDGPEPLPMPAAPWTRSRNLSRDEGTPNQQAEPAPVRKQSKITIIPSQPQENGTAKTQLKQDVVTAAKNKQELPPAPKDKKMDIQVSSKQTQPKEAPKERKIDIKVASKQTPKEESKPVTKDAPRERKVEIQQAQKAAPKEQKIEIQAQSKPATKPLQRMASMDVPQERKSSIVIPTPPKPPAPPMPPPPPPPGLERNNLTEVQVEKLDALRSRPRKRPDWGSMMKEVEGGKKLKHVQCNDRSSPLIPIVKVSEQFMYESEKPNVHNQLLKQIQGGVPLKRVQTNDRSRPILDGLRKFRRQLTIEEQIQKSKSVETVAEVEPDELDDIDKVRDDLQSTKQMLALELRNKEAVERENKRLQARLLNMEVELEKERIAKQQTQPPTAQEKTSEEQKMVAQLKNELTETQKTAQDMETRYHDTVGELDLAKSELEELRRKNKLLERRMTIDKEQPIMKQPSAKKLNQAPVNRVASAPAPPQQESEEEESEYEEETETEEEDSSEDEEKAAALREKREARELRLLATKVRSFKEKQDTARKERRALRMQLKNQQQGLRDEKKKYKVLHKEVDKMAKLMKEDEEEEEEEEEVEEEEETESEESSSEESDEDDSEGDLPAEAPAEERRKNFTARAKRHENILAVLKKGNYMLKANVDRLKDDLFKQKEMSLALQEDLNSVLAELG